MCLCRLPVYSTCSVDALLSFSPSPGFCFSHFLLFSLFFCSLSFSLSFSLPLSLFLSHHQSHKFPHVPFALPFVHSAHDQYAHSNALIGAVAPSSRFLGARTQAANQAKLNHQQRPNGCTAKNHKRHIVNKNRNYRHLRSDDETCWFSPADFMTHNLAHNSFLFLLLSFVIARTPLPATSTHSTHTHTDKSPKNSIFDWHGLAMSRWSRTTPSNQQMPLIWKQYYMLYIIQWNERIKRVFMMRLNANNGLLNA